MPNGFVIDNGFNALSDSTVTGSLRVTNGITGSLQGTSSWASNAISSSYALNATSASYSLSSTSASYALSSTSASYSLSSTSASYALNATSASYALNGTSASYSVNSTSASYALTASYAMNGGGGGGGATNQITSGSATASISPTAGFIVNTNSLISGSLNVTGSVTASAVIISGSGVSRLTVIGSGSASPLFTVQGSQGELFTVTDTLSGSLFSVGDISGLPILEVFSDNTTLMGSYIAPALYTTNKILSSTVGTNLIYSLATASYDGVFVDYTIKSGSNARAGTFIATWLGTSVNFMDNSTTDFGVTTGFVFAANVVGANMVVSGSGTTAGWTIKTIIKAI
jgi:hypothetical protein